MLPINMKLNTINYLKSKNKMESKLPTEIEEFIVENYNINDFNIAPTILNNINDSTYYLIQQNSKMKEGEYLVGYAETHSVRKARILKKFFKPINYIYYTGDFILTRVSPKLKISKNLYHFISKGKGRVLSRTEILGKLVYCGFDIVDEFNLQNKLVFVVKKSNDFKEDGYVPNEGLLITLPRLGKNGKIIKVYKMRTMHPYAQFIQKYVHDKNDLKEGGKLAEDFRISTIGKFMRKYWIDEFPMIINILKGEMKLIGVRPLSQHYMSLYDKDLQNLRTKTKPGLLPPFYADMPKTLEEIQNSERKYLKEYRKSPLKTDLKYFLKILNTIVIKGKRSG